VSTFEIKDLPAIVHQLQIIILACDIEARFKAQFGQVMDPSEARIQAMQHNAHPNAPIEARMSEDAYRAAIRVWKASRVLGVTWSENRRIDADTLIMAGL
jgi:hypothetical protein